MAASHPFLSDLQFAPGQLATGGPLDYLAKTKWESVRMPEEFLSLKGDQVEVVTLTMVTIPEEDILSATPF